MTVCFASLGIAFPGDTELGEIDRLRRSDVPLPALE
jgi:hypothetical protein